MNKFIPKSYKFKKIRKRVRTKLMFERRVISLKNYQFGLKSLDNGVISSVVLEAVRRSITKRLKRIGRLKINNFPYIPLTAKSLGVRMGKGVGSISSWVFPVRKGRILFEINNVSFDLAKAALNSAAKKLPIRTKFVYKYF